MAPALLSRYLKKLGHHAEGWGLGLNRAGVEIKHTLADLSPGWAIEPVARYRGEGSVPMLCDRMVARARERHAALGGPLTLIGWSLGGVVAREVARELPDLVEEVITLGTPVLGGPKYTAAAAFFRRRGMDTDGHRFLGDFPPCYKGSSHPVPRIAAEAIFAARQADLAAHE